MWLFFGEDDFSPRGNTRTEKNSLGFIITFYYLKKEKIGKSFLEMLKIS